MKILVVDDEPDLRELLVFMIETTFGGTVLQAGSASAAIEIVENNVDLACIVCDYDLGEGTGEDVFRHLLERGRTVPFILCSSHHPDRYKIFTESGFFGFVVKPDIYDPLRILIEKAVGGGAPRSSRYSRLKLELALKFGVLKADLYLKISDEKFLKILHKGAAIDSSDIEKFKAKNIEYLFIDEAGAKIVLADMINNVLYLSKRESLDQEPAILVSQEALNLVAIFNQSIGFGPQAELLTKESVKLVLKTIQQNVAIRKLFDQFKVDPESYRASHSIALAHISCGIASQMGWTSELTFYKLSLAAFLHDITLPNDRIAEVQSLPELSLRREQFTEEEMDAFLHHSDYAADILSTFSELPADVDIIIRQHHETPEENGFPRCLSPAQLAPLSCLFIIAHKMLHYIGHSASQDPIKDFLSQISPEHRRGHFGKIVKVIERASSLH